MISNGHGPGFPIRGTAAPYTAAAQAMSVVPFAVMPQAQPCTVRSYGFTKDTLISGSLLLPAETGPLCQSFSQARLEGMNVVCACALRRGSHIPSVYRVCLCVMKAVSPAGGQGRTRCPKHVSVFRRSLGSMLRGRRRQ